MTLISSSSSAFYQLEPIDIDLSVSAENCDIFTSTDLVALNCPDEPSFTIYDVEYLDLPYEVYSTTKAVAQIRPSKLGSVDSFISFIEAKNENDLAPTSYAFLVVVDADGVRDVGISGAFLPNRSIYLGADLMIKIKSSETSLQLYDITEDDTSSISISIYSSKLSYDYWPIDDTGANWLIVACQHAEETQSYPDCNFYTTEGLSISPKSRNRNSGAETTCASAV